MWQRFTDRARRVVFHAQEEAGRLGENYVSTEHLLLGLVREKDSAASCILEDLGCSVDEVRSALEQQITKGEGKLDADMQLTPRAKRVIDLSYEEARGLQQDFIGTEHLLLGMLAEGEGLAGRILQKLGVDLQETRQKVCAMHGLDETAASDQEGAVMKTEKAKEFAVVDLEDIASLTKAQLETLLTLTRKLKEQEISAEDQRQILAGKTLAMIFEKPSLRTRVSFETGIFQLGGHGIYLGPSDISLGKRESIADAARTLDRMCDMIMARTFAHSTVTELAKYAEVPVINGLSDLEHPCQALADFYTILEHKKQLDGLKLAFIGDGNNVAHSLMLLAAKVGTNFTIACPEGYEPDEAIVRQSREDAKQTGAVIEVVNDAKAAADGADVIYTDVWASMGQEEEREERARIFAPFQVNAELMNLAKDDAIFEHCLPAHRGDEVTDEVIDGRWSMVFDEAENRLHAQKAVMALLAG